MTGHITKVVLLIFSAISVSNPIYAGSAHQLDLTTLVESAKAVILGTVTNITYQNSSDGLPHTFVTYRVSNNIVGQTASELTLRFIGGPDGRGDVFILGDTPMFNVGDQDILLIRGNGKRSCPLVGCAAGRLRLIAGSVFNNKGIQLTSIEDGQLMYQGKTEGSLLKRSFPAPKFDELIKNPAAAKQLDKMKKSGMSLSQIRADFERSTPKTIELDIYDGSQNEISNTENLNTSNGAKLKQKESHKSSKVTELMLVDEIGKLKNGSSKRGSLPSVNSVLSTEAFHSGLKIADSPLRSSASKAETDNTLSQTQ